MLEYTCGWYGRQLAVIGRWYPSSTTCRDISAAKNILAAGLRCLPGELA